MEILKVGLVSVSDRASTGIYKDEGIPALEQWLKQAVLNPMEISRKLIADEQDLIEKTLIELCDIQKCHLVITTGGTGPYPRDVTPDATLNVATRVIPGFGEQMRQISLNFVPTAILSRQVGVIRNNSLILNLPGRPKAIAQTLGGVKNDQGKTTVYGIFASIPVCIDAVGGPEIFVDENFTLVYKPKK